MEDKVQQQYQSSVLRLQKFIQNYPDRVPAKVIQKLQILRASIDNKPLGKVDLLNEEEKQQLICHSIPLKYRMYIDIVNSFIYPEDIVKGRLDMKKKSGWFWNDKNLKLSLIERKMWISREDFSKPPKQLFLGDYSLKWADSVKNKFCFHLCGKEVLIFGSIDFGNAEKWFNYLRQCCVAADDELLKRIKQNKLQQRRQSEDMTQSLKLSKKSEILQSQPLDDNVKTHHKFQSQVQKKEEKKENQKQKQVESKQQSEIQSSPMQQQVSVLQMQTSEIQPPKQESKIPALFQDVIREKDKYSTDCLMNDFEFSLISFKNKLRLLQHKTDQAKIRAVTHIQTDQTEAIACAIACPDQMKQWNSLIDQTAILDIMPKNSSMIIAEQRKKFGMFYLKRSYTYLRYVMKMNGCYFIFDKSLPYKQSVQNGYQFEGQIVLSIIAVIPQQQLTMIIWETDTKNGGYANASQDAQLTLVYLQELQNLESYLCQKNYKIPVPLVMEEVVKETYCIAEQPLVVQEIEIKSSSSSEIVDCNEFKSQIFDDEPEFFEKNDYLQLLDLITKNPGLMFWSAIHNYPMKPREADNIYYQQTDDGKNVILTNDWEIQEKGGLRFVNQRKLEIQKEVITYMLKKLGTNLLAGKSLISISLPVNIFEKRSNLERACYSLGYMWLLEKAGNENDPFEQMKLVTQFSLTANYLFLNMEKPFNPILGETYQGYMNGNLLYCEQVSHHPPVLALYVIGRNFKLTGHLESQANFSANSITGQNFGYLKVEFPNQTTILFNNIPGCISGMTIGHRQFHYNGLGWLVDLQNKLFCDIQVTAFPGVFSKKTTPSDWMEGYIVRGTAKEVARFNTETYRKYQGTKNTQLEKLSTITGRWTSGMTIDGVEVLNWFKDFPYKLQHEQYPLASDSDYREDLIALKTGNMDIAQERKEKMEVLQRHDKKLRQKKKH